MDIQLRPEIEDLVRQDVDRGAYQSVDEYVEHAVSLLHAQETWLAEHRSEINSKIADGFAAAKRGELIDADRVRSNLQQKKRAWLTDRR